ncbi:hypothetical protein [Verrucosispora sp. NA02020]|uniref:hypothetical protein n=1 Tax=Verrucosispora sp. NA02020 TaxID=2742132 RepID=UPI0015910DF3|nr:hypothetical protein [Verrucosispora sp. NA02020]QKW11319.1 hypothetical protein HUT12_21315 [Verrucosispora sp. NA02020]
MPAADASNRGTGEEAAARSQAPNRSAHRWWAARRPGVHQPVAHSSAVYCSKGR